MGRAKTCWPHWWRWKRPASASFAAEGKEIWANVEFYKGAVFHSLGIPTHFFTAMFAMSRVYGYIAHFLEFSRDSRLIRPRANYTDPRSDSGTSPPPEAIAALHRGGDALPSPSCL